MTGIMLLGLLRERFHLQIHTEPRNTPVFLLTVVDRAHTVKPADINACVVRNLSTFPSPSSVSRECGTTSLNGRGGMRLVDSYSVPMASFAAALSSLVDRPIVDRTGMTGNYDIHLEFAKESTSSVPVTLNGEPSSSPDPGDSGMVSIFTAVQKQLGLKLLASIAPLDVIVVDHIDEATEN